MDILFVILYVILVCVLSIACSIYLYKFIKYHFVPIIQEIRREQLDS